MEINQALVVYKQLSATSAARKKYSPGQELHLETLDILYPLLRKFGISFHTCSTKQLRTIKGVDLVITVGGDGTVLSTSHFVGKIPIVGIKSYGRASVGYFCAATTDTMRLYMESLLEGHIRPKKLHRLEVKIGKHKVKELALNDILFAHAMPASTSKYKLTIGKRSEVQKSSGIWVSSAAGSTAVVTAAGGRPIPLGSQKMEYIVREPYAPSTHYKLVKGIIPNTKPLKIESLIKHGTVCIDGSHIQYPAPTRTMITIKGAKDPLNIFWKK
jgi:NAD+ kinase